jgi:aminoglycoside 3-N-acetyltransferase I
MQYQIQKLDGSDISLIQQLLILFKRVFDEGDINISDLPDKRYLESLLVKNGFCAFVALADDKVVGGLTAYELDMYMEKGKEAYLYDLAVDENYRRQGIARLLLTKLQEYAKENGISTIFVEAHVEDMGAIDFYKSMNAVMEEVCHFNIIMRQ